MSVLDPLEDVVLRAEDARVPTDTRIAAWNQSWSWLILTNQRERARLLAASIRSAAEERGNLAAAIQCDVVTADCICLDPGPKGDAIRLAEEAIVESQAFGLPSLEARARVVLGYALATVGSFHAGIEALLLAKESLRVAQDESMLAWTDLRLARALHWAEEPGGAVRTAERVLRWARKNADVALEAGALALLAESLPTVGRDDDARSSAEDALSLAQRHGLDLFVGEALVSLGDCAMREGDCERALHHYTEAISSFGRFPSLHLRLGRAYRGIGRDDLARGELDESVRLSVEQGYPDIEFPARDVLALIAESEGRLDEALRQTRLAREAERGHRTASFDRRVAEMLAGFEVERLAREASAERDRREAVERQAATDPLTELLNRRGFAAATSDVPEGPYSLFMLDLDRFKPINDECGHEVGDEVLRRVSRTLVDVVPVGSVVARVGGDEFAVMVPGAEVPQAREISAAIVEAIGAIDLSDIAVGRTVGVSVGCSHRHAGDDDGRTDLRELARAADRALYRAKTEGMHRYCADMLEHPDH